MIDFEARKKQIGGSDIAAIMGFSRWKTRLGLWAEKTGKLHNEIGNFEAAEIGTELEEFVSRKFSKKTGVQLRRDSRTFTHAKYEYLVAHIDRWVVGEDAIFEAKTCSAWKEKEWSGEDVPQEYILQCIWYCGILEKSKCYIAVLIGGQKFVWKEIKFDKELFEQMVNAAVDFWENFVLREVAPMASQGDSDTLQEMFPQASEKLTQLFGEEAELIDQLVEERAGGVEQKKLVEAELERIDSQIKQKIADSAGVETTHNRVTWKNQKRVSADTEKLKKDGLFEQYSKVSEFRVLNQSKIKAGNL